MILKNACMESLLNFPASGKVHLVLPNAEALNSLVNFNSELAYNSSTLHSGPNQEALGFNASRKLPAKLPLNRSIYEKELHQTVIGLYSKKEGFRQRQRHFLDTSSLPVFQRPASHMEGQRDHVSQELRVNGENKPGNLIIQGKTSQVYQGGGGFLTEGHLSSCMEKEGFLGAPRVDAPQPLDMMRMRETTIRSSAAGSEWYYSQDLDFDTAKEAELQSLDDLQCYLMKYQKSRQELCSPNASLSSDLNRPLFDDSGIRLELSSFMDSDVSQQHMDRHGTDAGVDVGFEKMPSSCKIERSKVPGRIVLEGQTLSSLNSPNRESHDVALNKSKKTENEDENSHGTEAIVENSEDKGSVRKLNQTAGRKWELDKTKGRNSVVPEGSSSVVSLTEKNDERLLVVGESFPLKKEKNADVKDGSRMHIRSPGQAMPVVSVISEIDGNDLNESEVSGSDIKEVVGVSLEDGDSRLQRASYVQKPPVTYMKSHAKEGFLSLNSDIKTKKEVENTRKTPQDLELHCASLEGKVESLQEEFAIVVEDRKLLQTRLHAVERRLREELEKARQTEPIGAPLVEELKQSQSELENQVTNLQRAYEEKGDHLDEAFERLKRADAAIQNLKQKLLFAEGEVTAREERVVLLQTEIESLRKMLEQARDQNEKFKRENLALNANIASLVDTKEWLQKQLKVAGEVQVKMQLETSELESSLAMKSHLVEELKGEGARSNQQLAKLQQSSLLEKADILKHMETVQEGITQQNLAHKQLELDKQQMERKMGAEIESLKLRVSSAVKIEKELDAAKHDLVLKEGFLETIVKEKDETKQQLTLARESTEELKRHLSELEPEFKKAKRELKKAEVDLMEKDSYIEKLLDEKRTLEKSLEVANEERAACDNAIYGLRLDLEKVDRRFKMMKRELALKKGQLEETMRQKDGFVGELHSLREGLEGELKASQAVKEELAQKEKIAEEFEELIKGLKNEIASLTQRLGYSEEQIARADKERKDAQDRLETAMREAVLLEEKLQQSLLERAKVEGEFQTSQQSNRDEMESLRRQNESLREQIQAERMALQTEVTKQRDRAINLEQELQFMADEMQKKENDYEQELRVVQENLEGLKENKEVAEQDLKELRIFVDHSVMDLKKRYENQLEALRKDFGVLQREKDNVEQKCDQLEKESKRELGMKRREVSQMGKEVALLKETLKQAKAEVERLQFCSVELEREKGRLAGVLVSQKTLRAHVEKVENEIATRETALAEARNKLELLTKESEIQRETASDRIQRLERQWNIAREEIQKLQCSLRKEKQEHFALKNRVEEGETERVELIKKLSGTEKELKHVQERIKREVNQAQSCRSQLEETKKNLVQEQTQCADLQRRLEAVLGQDEAKKSQVEGLEWELNRRNKEVEYLKEQLRVVEERQHLEMENLKTTVQVCRSESSSLRSELSEARKTKCAYQTETFELKDALLMARKVTESLKEELFVVRQELSEVMRDVLGARNLQHLQDEVKRKGEQIAHNEAKQNYMESSNGPSTNALRPISGLQECMSSLRSQISSLQKQMNAHTDSVLTATTSWRSFKENVHQLQASCSSQNGGQMLTAERDN